MVDRDIGGPSSTDLDVLEDDQADQVLVTEDVPEEVNEVFSPNLMTEFPVVDESEAATYVEKELASPEAELNPPDVSNEILDQSVIQDPEPIEATQQASGLKIKKSSIPKVALPFRRAAAIAEHEYLYKKAAPVIRNPLLPSYQGPGTKFKAEKAQSDALSVLQYPGHTKNLALERSELLCYKGGCGQTWDPNPLGCNIVKPVALKKSIRKARVKSYNDWQRAEENLKEQRDTELAIELGYETLVGNLLYIDIPYGEDINRSWQNYLSENAMEWGFPYYKGTKERPRMKQPEPYLAHQNNTAKIPTQDVVSVSTQENQISELSAANTDKSYSKVKMMTKGGKHFVNCQAKLKTICNKIVN